MGRSLSLFLILAAALSCSAPASKKQPPKKVRYWKQKVTKPVSPGKLVAARFQDKALLLRYQNMETRIRFLKGGIVHVRSAWGTLPQRFHSYAVVGATADNGVKTELQPGQAVLQQGNLRLVCDTSNLSFSLLHQGKPVYRTAAPAYRLTIQETRVMKNQAFHRTLTSETNLVHHATSLGRVFGLGEKTGDLELSGRSFRFFNSDTYKYKKTTDPIYSTFPFFLSLSSTNNYGMFLESMAESTISFTNGVRFAIYDKLIDQYIIPGRAKAVLRKLAQLTGKPVMLPAWGLGFHQSRYSYRTQEEVLSIASNFRFHKIPLDCIYLDIGFMDSNRCFTWDSKKFPDPRAMHKTLRKIKVRTISIQDPGVGKYKGYHVYDSGKPLDVFCKHKGKDYMGRVWPGNCVFPDYTNPRARRWWGWLYKRILDLGVAGIWNDMNEPSVFGGPRGTFPLDVRHHYEGIGASHKTLHNVYGTTMVMSTYEGLRRLRPRKRPFILTRAGYTGLQRYGVLWTGDNTANWDHLAMNLSMVLNIGLSGMPYSGADIGGYTGSPGNELFVRWIQLATFVPFCRDHTEKGTKMQEPYRFKSIDTIRRYIRLRYRLFPYLYTQAWRSHKTGLPFFQPLFLEYGSAFLDVHDQYMVGNAILGAPILKAGQTQRRVVFPPGVWYDLHNQTRFHIKQKGSKQFEVGLDDSPMFVRGGSILPFYEYPAESTMDFSKHRELTLRIYPDARGRATGEVYEDALDGYAYLKGGYRLYAMRFEKRGTTGLLTIGRSGNLQLQRTVQVMVPKGVATLKVNGRAWTVRKGVASLPAGRY